MSEAIEPGDRGTSGEKCVRGIIEVVQDYRDGPSDCFLVHFKFQSRFKVSIPILILRLVFEISQSCSQLIYTTLPD